MSRSHRSIVAAFLITLSLLAPHVRAAEKVLLKVNMPAGTSWSFNSNQDIAMDSTVKANGQTQQLKQKMSRKLIGTIDVLETDAQGKPAAVKITFDKNCLTNIEQNGQTQALRFPLAGQVVTVRSTNGEVSHDFRGQLDPQTDGELKQMLDQDDSLLPNEAVGVGDSWKGDPQKLAKKWDLDPTTTKLAINMTMKELKEVAGRRAAAVDVTIAMDGNMEGMSGKRNLSGTCLIDLATGRQTDLKLDGTLSMAGLKQQQGPNGDTYVLDIKTDGTMKIANTAEIKGAAPNAPAPVSPAPVAQDSPRGGNPLAGAIAGTYKNDALTVKFTPAGGGSSVDINFGGKQYTGNVTKFEGTTFAGKFKTADNSEFDFTGTLNGSDMTFSTGGTDYKLKSDAQKKNPLAQ